jgi:type VI protein secretion system component VasA
MLRFSAVFGQFMAFYASLEAFHRFRFLREGFSASLGL